MSPVAGMRVVNQVMRLAGDKAIIFGEDWNATITGAPSYIDYLADASPGVIVDIVPASQVSA